MDKNIVISYLENMFHALYEQKLNIEQQCYKKETLLKNNQKFISTLHNSLDDNLGFFSPREQDKESHDKISCLEKEQRVLEGELQSLTVQLKTTEKSLNELEMVLKYEREHIRESLSNLETLEKSRLHYYNFLEVQDREHQRMAKKLYDVMIHTYDNMLHRIELCSRLVNVDTIRSHKELNEMAECMKHSMQKMLKVIYDVPSMSLEGMGLTAAIGDELSVLEKHNIVVSFQIEGKEPSLPMAVKLTILKVLKESCDNIIQHSKARNVAVKISYGVGRIVLLIEDNGVGFDEKLIHNNENAGVGIAIMEERVFFLEGKISIKSVMGKGTEVYLEIPMES
ncbi:MAG: hypothetical protein HFH38_13095 [Lachnospiraceae bacterium]|jgi:two-component system sensor histidine kinase DegS|nr:hypothetical protein [Lachnospiraceae bacterium]